MRALGILVLLSFNLSPTNGFSRTFRLKPEARSTRQSAIDSSSLLESSVASVGTAVELGTFPAVGMLAATAAGLKFPTPPAVIGALQHFSAGILLTTVAKELLPEMVKAQGIAENVASGAGFFSGVGLLIVLGIILPEEPEMESTERAVEQSSVSRLRQRRLSKKGEAFALTSCQGGTRNDRPIDDGGAMVTKQDTSQVRHLKDDEEALATADIAANNDSTLLATTAAALPIAFLAAIALDATLDGLLIGISLAADPGTGPILSASMTVESTFLGLTIATALRGRPEGKAVLASGLGPAGLLAGSLAGGFLAPTLVDSPVLLAALLGFGTSTILFMVAEELLLEAHEEGGEHIWWVDFQLYTGFFASVMVEKLVGM